MTQIKELLRIGLFVIIVLCGTSACSNDDSDDDELAKDYKLKEVAWIMQDDEVKIIKQTIPGFLTDNNTDEEMKVTVKPTADVRQSSCFYTDDVKLFQLLTQTPNEIYVPGGFTLLPSDHFSYINSGPKTLFSLEGQYIPLMVEITHESTIPPHHRLIYNHIISLREVNATYRACFTEINTGKELQITGKWTGKFFIQNEGETLLEEIK